MRVALFGHGHMGRLHAQKLQGLGFQLHGAGGGPPATPPTAPTPVRPGGPAGAPAPFPSSGTPLARPSEAPPGASLGAGLELVLVDPAQGLSGDLSAIDAAIIATPTATHADVALPLLARGIPCLIEKPLAATLDEARALAAYPHVMVGHVERFNPAVAPLRGVDVRFVQAERVGRWTPRGTDVDVILDLMIHDLDLFLHLTGEDVVEVRANGMAVATGGYDLAHARVETASGRVGTFTASRLARQPGRRWRVFGQGKREGTSGASDGVGADLQTGGMRSASASSDTSVPAGAPSAGAPGDYWSLDLRERALARVSWGGGDLLEERVAVAQDDALAAQMAAFLAAVRGERPYATPGADGVRALELAFRIRDAIREGAARASPFGALA